MKDAKSKMKTWMGYRGLVEIEHYPIHEDMPFKEFSKHYRYHFDEFTRRENISPMLTSELQIRLRKFLDDDSYYLLIQLGEGLAMKMKGINLWTHIDDIWHPSGDDIIVTHLNEQPLFAIDHEEVLYFFA